MGDDGTMTVDENELRLRRAPEQVIAEAQAAAKALMAVVAQKPRKIEFNGQRYIDWQDYQTLGKMFGITARVTRTAPVECGTAHGWEASAVALDATGREIAAADAMCLNDEEKWSARPKYEYHYAKKSGGLSAEDPGKDEIVWEKTSDGKSRPKKDRVNVGMVAVPMFQLRSMAQTRACVKALRSVLGFVAVMAGFAATPEEEMTGDETEEAPKGGKTVKTATRKGAAPATPAAEDPVAQAVAAGRVAEGYVMDCGQTIGTNSKGPYTLTKAKVLNEWFSTFAEADGKVLLAARASNTPVKIAWEAKGDFKNILAVKVVEDEFSDTAAAPPAAAKP